MTRLRRWMVQPVCFAVLMFGGRLGIHLGAAVPCFVCPYVGGCAGQCYLMGLQGVYGFGLSWAALFSPVGLKALGWLAVFALSVVLFGKLWCGWACPFGALSDWVGGLRRLLGFRESRLSPCGRPRLGWVKYALLAACAILPPLATAKLLPPDFYLPFCNICPGKSLLSLFAGDTTYLALNTANGVTLGFTAVLLAVTGVTLAGLFFKDRFFCHFCPMLALIHLLAPLSAPRLGKWPDRCTGCGNCRRNCAMEVERAYLEKVKATVQDSACVGCLRCVEACPSDGALGAKLFGLAVVRSSRHRAAVPRKAKS